jgi:hypothetical protein
MAVTPGYSAGNYKGLDFEHVVLIVLWKLHFMKTHDPRMLHLISGSFR